MFTLFCIVLIHGIPYGLAVSIPGFHPGGSGSTPGVGTFLSVQASQVFSLLSFYQALRLVTLNLSKSDVLFQQLYFENFLTSYDSWT